MATVRWAGARRADAGLLRRLGGTVRVIIPDNLREGVLTPDI
jgi:hypothetical protein